MALGINIWWEKGEGKRYLGIGGGIIERLSLEEIALLRDLQIGESIGRRFRLHSFESKEALEDYINPLEGSLRLPLLEFIEKAQDTETQLPSAFNDEKTKAILSKRGILNDNGRLINDENGKLEKARVQRKAIGIKYLELRQKVLNAFQLKELAFGIKNEGAHWTYLRLNVTPKVSIASNIKKDIWEPPISVLDKDFLTLQGQILSAIQGERD